MSSALIPYLALTIYLLATTKAQSNTTTSACTAQRLNEVLGTNKYLLYGLTADCQLFFATSVPDGEDLGKRFGPQSIPSHYDRNVNCKSARLFPVKNVNNELKLLLLFAAPPQIYAHVFDFQAPPNGQWYSIITGANNGPIVSQCPLGALDCLYANFTQLINVPSQRAEDPILGFFNPTSNEFNLFYRNTFSAGSQPDMNTYTILPDGTLNRTAIVANVLTKVVSNLFIDAYKNNLYIFDIYNMYRFPINQTNSVNELNSFESKEKMSIPYNTPTFNFYVANDMLFRSQYASQTQGSITIQTVPTNLNGVQNGLSSIPFVCIGQLLRPNNYDYSSIDNFQMTALFYNDYDTVIGTQGSQGHNGGDTCPLKLLTVFALVVLAMIYQE